MSNNINWGKIYESTYWGNTDNNISWGKVYADLAGVVPALVSEFVSRVEADGGSVESTECLSTNLTFLVQNPEPVAFTGLLNDYSGAAAAYSLRLLDNTYTGDAIVVRRASDNTTQAIGFVNNELDTATLESFCSGTDGFVTTWYDQSGNGNDATQASASAQPKIVSSGSTILENGKATLEFDGSNRFNSSINLTAEQSAIAVATKSTSQAYLTSDNLNHHAIISGFINGFESFNGPRFTITSSPTTTIGIISQFISSTFASFYNQTAGATGTTSDTSATTILRIGGYESNTIYDYTGKITEMIFYSSDERANQSGIYTNINDFYSIY